MIGVAETRHASAKMPVKTLWIFARAGLILFSVAGVLSPTSGRTNINFMFSLVSATVFSIMLFAWLAGVNRKGATSLTSVFAWNGPFFPMRTYPPQFWAVTSQSCTISGAIGLAANGALGGNVEFAILMLSFGVGILGSVLIWVRVFSK